MQKFYALHVLVDKMRKKLLVINPQAEIRSTLHVSTHNTQINNYH